MIELTIIQKIAVWILPVLFAITLHEAGHAYAAYKLGDPTAKLLGRLSLNPAKHVDPIGTFVVPLALGFLTKFTFLFGWAKPVPISPRNFKHQKRDNAIVALAGPAANFVMIFLWALLMKIGTLNSPNSSPVMAFFVLSGQAGILINAVLCLLNLLPIPPLDGSRVVSALLPEKYDYYYAKLENYGLFILIFLMLSGVLGWILSPLLFALLRLIYTLFSI